METKRGGAEATPVCTGDALCESYLTGPQFSLVGHREVTQSNIYATF